uniref:Large ribosomal subunit protein uL2c n=1 Tax=Euglena longa TaxID=3037 RepID=RK2_EUGLO|nr:ribosomal protein L2 [Euglena longa]P34768.1 RecName: Full=Large ribosomal subunit protein uL2c; AltName: Full=50S ribosomal protein L2, plastid [Euglena longa]CAC24596.1 ribosomal protein L2 [Euglena longa]
MVVRIYNPCTPGTRHRSVNDFSGVANSKYRKNLSFFLHRSKGRNNRGVITNRNLGGGHKRLFRKIEFKRDKFSIFGKVLSIEYDPNRSSRIALVIYSDGIKRYIIQPLNLVIGNKIISDFHTTIDIGNALPVNFIPLGTLVHNVEFKPGNGGKIARAAGAFSKIIAKDKNFVSLSMPSGETRLIENSCWATIGQVGNLDFYNVILGKAGRNRWLGNNPSVRGIAMNPCDHPHGGGEGRSPIGRSKPLTPWGKIALGKRTRKPKRYSNKYILSRK